MSDKLATDELREKIDWHIDQNNAVALGEVLKAACDVIDANYEAHQRAGSVSAEEFGNAYGRHEMAGELADALDEVLDLTEG